MEITIPIPKSIIEQCSECGYTEEQTKIIFQRFIYELMNQEYDHFSINFDIWLNSGETEDTLLEILK